MNVTIRNLIPVLVFAMFASTAQAVYLDPANMWVDDLSPKDQRNSACTAEPLSAVATVCNNGESESAEHRSLLGRLIGWEEVRQEAADAGANPLPPIALLLGSALVGIGTISRRRS